MVGYGGKTINTLRLWAAAAPDYFDFQVFSHGDFVGAVAETLAAESLTRVLYPDDSTSLGQGLRFVQEYFLVACSLADLVRRFRRGNSDWSALPDKVAIQLNDTHPTLAVPELMRILLDEAHLGWDEAWDLTQRTLAYTNHTLLPEALEKWPLAWFELLLPRHLEIIFEINRRLLDDVRARFPGDEGRVRRISLIEEGAQRKIRMANLAIVGSHSTNGVAAIHSELLRTMTVKDLAEMFPERFNNKTNGVTPRRWLLAGESRAVRRHHRRDRRRLDHRPREIEQAQAVRRRPGLPGRIPQGQAAGQGAVRRLAQSDFGPERRSGHHLRLPGQAHPRIQAAAAQRAAHGRALQPAARESRPGDGAADLLLRRQGGARLPAGQAHHQVHQQPRRHDRRRPRRWPGRLKVVFLPEYCVSLAERLIPAADVSNQISTAGYEASGTSNMKFMMNGALTIGTRDGATIEMAEEAGEENFFLFGLTAQQVADSRSWYDPHWHYDHEPETRAALDLIFSDYFSRYEPGIFAPLRDTLLTLGDHYMHLADLQSYLDADQRLVELYGDPQAWARKAILNVASSGKFSSDRTISEYATQIWNVKPCPVG